ncbi:hypothetical protein PV327_002849 [Microctonus hyperodae]|uniref:Peptidase M13 N-terminal domain-containing protein n=1 Tax=Microctonus hyperodae TaxID=165561 RepID=A0AA39KPH0_MICHY|nr:hypothetical protein PV327_002849 [Microctonus hyperodae]
MPNTTISELSSIFEIEENDETLLENKKNTVCDTKECHIIAKELIRGMNMSVSPCDNLYDFVCGSWETESRIPDHEAAWSRFQIYQDTVHRRIKSVLETEPSSSDILPVRQAKKWYRSCLDVGVLEGRGLHPMEAVLLQLGGWPMTLDPEEWDEKEHSWQNVEHGYFHITGDHVFYEVSAIHWGRMFGIMLGKGSVPLHEKFPEKYRNYTGDDDDSYTKLITVVAKMFADYNKASITNERIEKDVKDLVEFEKELHLLVDDDQGRYSDWTLGEFVEWYNANVSDSDNDDKIQKIDFANLIRRKFDLVNHEIEDSDSIFFESYDYFVQLTQLLNRTPTRTIVNYIHWNFVSDMLAYTTETMRDALFDLLHNEFDVKKRQPRWLECIEEMKMTTAAAYAFVQKYFSQEVEDAAKEMIANVREEMAKQIESSNWMDDDTKTIAKEKLNAMDIYIGFPDWYKNETSVLNSYKGLAIGYDHFDNILNFK